MNICFIGEDRTFGNSELYVDMIPKSCWFTNVRYCVKKEDWNKIRKQVYQRVNYKCECCFIDCIKNKILIEAHERWKYDYQTQTQKLIRLVGLCKLCHEATHLGLATINGRRENAILHLCKVNGWTQEEAQEHIDISTAVWNERNQFEWNLDLEILQLNGIEINKPVETFERELISKNKVAI